MSDHYKKISINFNWLNNLLTGMRHRSRRSALRLVLLIYSSLVLGSCSLMPSKNEPTRLTLREENYEKGAALLKIYKYKEASLFFTKVIENPPELNDSTYDLSLWNMAIIHEKYGQPDQALLALNELALRSSTAVSQFKIQLAQMKNYFRVANPNQARLIRLHLDEQKLFIKYDPQDLFEDINEVVTLNYDYSILDELDFIGEIQKYFLYVMEESNEVTSQKALHTLIGLMDSFIISMQKDYFNTEIKQKIAIRLLDQFQNFDNLKMDSFSKKSAVAEYTTYSAKKQKYLIDWLYNDKSNKK